MKKSISCSTFEVFNCAFMVFIWVIMLYPFLFVLSASLSNNSSVLTGRVGIIPHGLRLDAYQSVFSYEMVWISYRNTVVYTLVGTTINMVMTILAAYPLARTDLPGRGAVVFYITVTMFFSGGLIPSFLLVRNLGLYNTMWAIVLPGALSTWNMIVLRTFFQSIPLAVNEAAIIDGANDLQVLLRITLPLSTAALMTIGMFYAVGHWNSWFSAMIYLRDAEKYPVQIILRQIVLQNQTSEMTGSYGSSVIDNAKAAGETIKYATIMVTALPILMIYPFIQRYFVKGVMIGAIKG